MDRPADPIRHRQVDGLHVAEVGDPADPSVVLLHGWPQSWRSWRPIMELEPEGVHVLAIDLPGIGKSRGVPGDGTKAGLAGVVHDLIARLELGAVTLVGHDAGGMVAFAYACAFDDLAGVVIADVVIPGLDPWDEVVRNPLIWHFALHAVPRLPERLVQGRQGDYFDFFFDTLAADAAKITPRARADYVHAYSTDEALTAGFDWYRAFPKDVEHNTSAAAAITTPLLYVRGDHEWGDIDTYVAGLERAGVDHVQKALLTDAGHFTPEEAPRQLWQAIANFMAR